MRLMRALCLAAALATCPSASVAQPRERAVPQAPIGESGIADGAPYRLDVPAHWNGELIVLYHGYQVVGEPRPDPYPGFPGTALLLERGYAVIQSAYSRQGWAVAEALAETRALRTLFERRFGRPSRAFAIGFSMGGHLALATVERDHQAYDGALSLCGVNMPARDLFDRAVGDLAAAQLLFPNAIPDLAAAGSPADLGSSALASALAAAPESARRLSGWMGIDTGDLPGTLWLYYAVVREMRGRANGFPGDNSRARYSGFGDDDAFNRNVRRYRADPAARAYVRANANLTGRLQDHVVLLDNEYDDLISAATRTIYPAAVRRAGRGRLLTVLPPAGRGHCNFTPAQIVAAFDELVRQVDRRRARR